MFDIILYLFLYIFYANYIKIYRNNMSYMEGAECI